MLEAGTYVTEEGLEYTLEVDSEPVTGTDYYRMKNSEGFYEYIKETSLVFDEESYSTSYSSSPSAGGNDGDHDGDDTAVDTVGGHGKPLKRKKPMKRNKKTGSTGTGTGTT